MLAKVINIVVLGLKLYPFIVVTALPIILQFVLFPVSFIGKIKIFYYRRHGRHVIELS